MVKNLLSTLQALRFTRPRRRTAWLIQGCAALLLLLLLLNVHLLLPMRRGWQERTEVTVRVRSELMVESARGDGAVRVDSLTETYRGYWVHPHGWAQTAPIAPLASDTASGLGLLLGYRGRLEERRSYLVHASEEISYYLRTHNETDDWLERVTAMGGEVEEELRACDSLLQVAAGIMARGSVVHRTVHRAEIVWSGTDSAIVWGAVVEEPGQGLCRSDSVVGLPRGAAFRRTADLPFGLTVWWRSLRQWWHGLLHPIPARPVLPRGTVVWRGHAYTGQLSAGGVPHGQGSCNGYEGTWQHGQRHGLGRYTDRHGTRFYGRWQADTLCEGWSLSASGERYCGQFNARLQREGEGVMRSPVEYYEGEWHNGLRHGKGLGLNAWSIVMCGHWQENRFRGEQMRHTEGRVYGIDISRYQHEIGKRSYGINWQQLRITHLGRWHGAGDYPVQFCFIKATDGTSIRSRYYAADAKAARKAGMAVGAYHFFQPSSGEAQAKFFLSVAQPQAGDMPPVLDVELTDNKIQKMGGEEAMRREMKHWLRVVQERTRTLPILYMSQGFIEKYHINEDRELRQYPKWIARYHELRPYMRLEFWQLSCTGRVRGIRRNVDIDVFNGTQEQFQEWLIRNGVMN